MIFKFLNFDDKTVRIVYDEKEVWLSFKDILCGILKINSNSYYTYLLEQKFGEKCYKQYNVSSSKLKNRIPVKFFSLEQCMYLLKMINDRQKKPINTTHVQQWINEVLPLHLKDMQTQEVKTVKELPKVDTKKAFKIDIVKEKQHTISAKECISKKQDDEFIDTTLVKNNEHKFDDFINGNSIINPNTKYPECNGFSYKEYNLDIVVIYNKIFFSFACVKKILSLDNDNYELIYYLQSFQQDELEKAQFKTFKEFYLYDCEEVYVEYYSLRKLIRKFKTKEGLEFLSYIDKNIIPNLLHNYIHKNNEEIKPSFNNQNNLEFSKERNHEGENSLSLNFNDKQVRIITNEDNETMFCLSDICKILELSNPSVVKDTILKEFELPKLSLGSFDTGFGIKEFTMIDEAQLYYVMNNSRSPKAKPFRMWVNKEVLPSIRKHGYYKSKDSDYNHDNNLIASNIISHKESLLLALKYLDKSEYLRMEVERLKLENERLRNVFQRGGNFLFTQVAKVCDIKEDELRDLLLGYNIISYFDKKMIATAHAIENNYAKMKLTDTRVNMYVQVVFTPKTIRNIEMYKLHGAREDLFL
ncbi:TPA: phage antirepressor KilAC domain-containing protein [Campylobacter lari]|nr:phage antirepressor KilAC domain-containing protein [Campylobacter lari]